MREAVEIYQLSKIRQVKVGVQQFIFNYFYIFIFTFFSVFSVSKESAKIKICRSRIEKKQKLESAKKPGVVASLDGISQERNGK